MSADCKCAGLKGRDATIDNVKVAGTALDGGKTIGAGLEGPGYRVRNSDFSGTTQGIWVSRSVVRNTIIHDGGRLDRPSNP